MMNEHLLYQLLKIIKFNGNIWELIDSGYEFGQVTHFIDSLSIEGYTTINEQAKTVITPAGDIFIKDFEARHKVKQYSKWILPRNEMWKKPIAKNYIYIPKE
jgi:hypothetical protein